MDAVTADAKVEYAMADSCVANSSDKREGQQDYAAANGEYGGRTSGDKPLDVQHCCIL